MIGFYKDRFVGLDDRVSPIEERGGQFGDGVYEVIRFYNGKAFMLDEHLKRLQKSADAIALKLPLTLTELQDLIEEGLKRSNNGNIDAYLQITRGVHPRQHHYPLDCEAVLSMTFKPSKKLTEEERLKGIKTITVEDDRWKNCFIKSLNLLPNVMAKQKAIEAGAHEAVYVSENVVKEGSSTNVFVVREGILYTYPLRNSILHGITRQAVIDLAKHLDFQIIEEPFTLEFLKDSDEMFITSTTMEITPVAQIDNHQFDGDFPCTRCLIERFFTNLSNGQ